MWLQQLFNLAKSQPEQNPTIAVSLGRWAFLGYGAPCAVTWTLYLILHWPGMLSNDSTREWLAAVNSGWHDNPVMLQITIWLVTRLWFSPGAVLLVYISAFSGLIGLALARQRAFGLPLPLVLLTSFGIALFPTHMRVTTWLLNDLPYTISMVALTIMILEIVQTNGAWLKRSRHTWILLGLAAASTALHRHNGPMPAFLTLACLLLVYIGAWRRLAAALILAGILFFIVKGPVIKALEARPYIIQAKPTLISGLVLWPISAHLHAGTPMSFEDHVILAEWNSGGFFTAVSQSYGKSLAWPVNPVHLPSFPFDRCNPLDWRIIKVWANLTLTNPIVTLKHHALVSPFVWRIREGPNETYSFVSEQGDRLFRNPLPDAALLMPYEFPVLLTSGHEFFGPRWSAKLLRWTNSPSYEWLFWRAGTWTCLILLVLVPAVVRTHRWKYALVLIPAFINSAILAILANVPEFRHVYPMVMISQLFFFFFGSMALGRKGSINVPAKAE